jgi:hypothetical protein
MVYNLSIWYRIVVTNWAYNKYVLTKQVGIAVMLWTYILEELGSNPSWNASYPGCGFA